MNQPSLRIEQELHVVHKTKDAAAKLQMSVHLFFDDEGGVSRRQHGLPQPGLGPVEIAGPAQRPHAMRRILFRHGRDTVRRGGAGSQHARHLSNVTRDFRRMPALASGRVLLSP